MRDTRPSFAVLAARSEYFHVEKPFLDQLAALGWTVVDQGNGMIPGDPRASLRGSFREWLFPEVFREAVRALNRTPESQEWLTGRQLDELRDQLLRHPSRTLLEANEEVQKLLFKAQVDVNEVTGEPDPVVKLIDFVHPERNVFHAINQFRIDTPGCVKSCIIPDIVLFVNGIPLVVVEAKIGDAIWRIRVPWKRPSLHFEITTSLEGWSELPDGSIITRPRQGYPLARSAFATSATGGPPAHQMVIWLSTGNA